MNNEKKINLTTPPVLAFERKLDPSDALMYAGKWDEKEKTERWNPIKIREKAVRGTISNRLKTKNDDSAKFDAKIDNPNLQRVDVASLPSDCDTLRLSFTIKVLGNIGDPSACSKPDYRKKLKEIVQGYVNEFAFDELAKRYAFNIANARFLWRNRLGAEDVEVHVNHWQNGKISKSWKFDALKISTRHFECKPEFKDDIAALSHLIKNGLSNKEFTLLEVVAFARMGKGQEVFPSQELILDKSKDEKSKVLYSVGEIAALHSQKIGNAVRTIDSWYPSDNIGEPEPIPVEPYGSVTSLGKAYRQPKEKTDFYNLLDNWVIKNNKPKNNDQHFVIAILIRGGVFGESEKE